LPDLNFPCNFGLIRVGNKELIKSLLNFATANLKNAKAVHDELEEEYKAIMDYSGLNNFSEQFIEKLFA
jgi:hypothetical protein